MKQILIPTDFSKNSWNAITYALELFKKSTCTFHLLHISPVLPYGEGEHVILSSPEAVEEMILKKSRKKLQALLKQIGGLPYNPEHTFVTNSVYAFFVESIRREIADKGIELVIMGTKGATGLSKLTVGSNTGDVMTKVKCPLLAIPENSVYSRPREIAFPTDYRMGYSQNVLSTLEEMAIMTKAALRILYVPLKSSEMDKEQTKNKEFLHEYLKDLEHSFHTVHAKKLETAVQCFVESRDIDMIAMVAKNLNFLQRILFRPVVEEISYHTNLPFLVLHE